jgi:hypothetical protein
MLDYLDKQDIWCFGIQTINMFFCDESKESIKKSLKRHTKNGLITHVCRGFYANPRARSMPAFPLFVLPYIIRSSERFYVSLEKALSDYGIISQIPFRLTLVTSGRTQTYKTPYGVIEFTHSNRAIDVFYSGDYIFYEGYGAHYASPKIAIRDALRMKRSVDLIDFDEVESAMGDFNKSKETV